jgi:hypothetical protein
MRGERSRQVLRDGRDDNWLVPQPRPVVFTGSFNPDSSLIPHTPLKSCLLLAGKRRRSASATLACRFVAVGAVFGVNRLPRGHDLGRNLLRGHIGRRETEADSRCKQSTESKNLCSRFSGRHGSATERLSDGATGPTGLCALRAHHTRLIKTGDYQARSFTALEAAM